MLTVEQLITRPVGVDQLASRTNGLFEIGWVPVTPKKLREHTVVEVPAGEVHEVTEQVMTSLQDKLSTAETIAVITRNAVHTAAPDAAAAAVWGMVRSAQSENPGRIVVVDTDDSVDLSTVVGDEPQIAVREGKVFAPRLAKAGTSEPVEWSADDTVMITGGTGTLGQILARHLVARHGVGEVVLVSRRGQAPEALADLANVRTVACDTSDKKALRKLLKGIPGLTAVVHTAGVVDDGLLTSLTPQQLHNVLRPKADAAQHLHELTKDLKAFVLYSSLAGTLGNPGQANYAAANAYLDGLAELRKAQGLPATSLAWGLWEDASGTTGHLSGADRARIAREGLSAITAEQGMAMFDAALGLPNAVVVATPINLTAVGQAPVVPPLLRGLVRRKASTTVKREDSAAFAAKLAGLGEAEQLALLLDLVRTRIAVVLGHNDSCAIAPDVAFEQLGFDSLTAVELRNQLTGATGAQLSPTLVFDHPTPAALARHLREMLAPSGRKTARVKIDEMAALLSTLVVDADDHSVIAEQLEDLLTRWRRAAGEPDSADDTDLDAASDDELFSLVDTNRKA